ncbi:hypothetical protein ACFSL6_20800 [Paenibacillus thailandensis]|uniref:Uncharacterized protein n=1 Tax=Paenibacillus thailandensis TaxID=393250 RepID=A0ABW5R2V3_9BACL
MTQDLRIILKSAIDSNKPVEDINQSIRELEQKMSKLRLNIKMPEGFMEAVVKLSEAQERLAKHIESEYPNISKIAPKLSAQLVAGPLLFAGNTLNFDFHKELLRLLDEHITKYGNADLPSRITVAPRPTDVSEIINENEVETDKYWEVVFRWIEIIMILYTLISDHQTNQQMDRIEDKIDGLIKQRPPIEQFYEHPPIPKQVEPNIDDSPNDTKLA